MHVCMYVFIYLFVLSFVHFRAWSLTGLLQRVYDNWYPLRKKDDELPDVLGTIAMRMNKLEDAVFFFKVNFTSLYFTHIRQ